MAPSIEGVGRHTIFMEPEAEHEDCPGLATGADGNAETKEEVMVLPSVPATPPPKTYSPMQIGENTGWTLAYSLLLFDHFTKDSQDLTSVREYEQIPRHTYW